MRGQTTFFIGAAGVLGLLVPTAAAA